MSDFTIHVHLIGRADIEPNPLDPATPPMDRDAVQSAVNEFMAKIESLGAGTCEICAMKRLNGAFTLNVYR